MYDTSHELLDKEAERELAVKMVNGCAASKDKLLRHNVRLVYKIAHSFYTEVPFEDLIQEGILALSNSLDSFDPYKGWRITTYIHQPIFWHIKRYIEHNSKYKSVEYEDVKNGADFVEPDRDVMRLFDTAMNILTPDEKNILVSNGVLGNPDATMADSMGRSREKVRQVKKAAIRKIHNQLKKDPQWQHLF